MNLDVDLKDDPIAAMRRWYREAEEALHPDEAHAIALATVDGGGWPAVRIVLARSIDDAGNLVFYTNYESRKGHELDATKRAAAVFHWRHFGRQCRVEGPVDRTSAEQSDAYWASRPRASRISALASPQSQPIDSFEQLEDKAVELEKAHPGDDVPRPRWWGGYILTPLAIEFWAQGQSRLHERLRFERPEPQSDTWARRRLGP